MMPEKKHIIFWITFILLLAFSPLAQTLSYRIAKITVPPFTQIIVEGATIQGNPSNGHYTIYFPENFKFPFTLKAMGPLGGSIEKKIASPRQLANLKIKEGIIRTRKANPQKLQVLPRLCPRLKIEKKISSNSEKIQKIDYIFVYEGSQDRMNHIPVFQLLDKDAGKGVQYKTYAEIDMDNVLLLKKVEITNDYEDTAIVDYVGPHPITGKNQTIHEGEGGFYANIHYAVVPYDKKILKMDRQTLLHFAQGNLEEIEKKELRPELRTHSFIPGPFLSKTGQLYELCEWGDTTYQAPKQSLNYKDIALWDWDYSVKNADHILLIIWEGDEEDWLYREQLIHPFYLTDDLIGIFEIKKKDAKDPLTLKNEKGDFTITVQTGKLKVPPRGK